MRAGRSAPRQRCGARVCVWAETHANGQPLPDPGRHEAQHDPPDRQPQPEARLGHAAGEPAAAPHAQHEGDDPPAHGHLDAHVAEEEEGAEPGDARAGAGEEGFAHAVLRLCRCDGMGLAEGGARRGVEGVDGCCELEGRGGDLECVRMV